MLPCFPSCGRDVVKGKIMMKRIHAPLDEAAILSLRAGDTVLLSGTIYTARDAAHARLDKTLDRHEPLPIDLSGQVIYYLGPAPAGPGRVIGSAGPTSSYRMDAYTPRLLELGLKGMIGKGRRSQAVKDAMKKHCCVYFAATGGAAALTAKCITKSEVVAYDDLGTEAIRKLTVEDFPVIVADDCYGGDQYVSGPAAYLEQLRRT